MKNERLHTYLCSTAISFCLALGAVTSMATGLDLPVKPVALVIWFAILAAVIAGLSSLRFGSLIVLGLGSIFLLNPDLWTEFKTIAATVASKLTLGYGIPIPVFLEGEVSKQVLSALCVIGGLIMIATTWAIQKQKTAIPAAILSLLPLACCITVTDTVPDSLCLFLWGFGLVLLLITQGARHQNAGQGNRLTAFVAPPVALALLLIFWLIPKDAANRWSIADLPQQFLSHFSGTSGSHTPQDLSPPEVDLSALAERTQLQTAVMDVTADFTGPLYLRSRDYDEYTGTDWISTPNRTEELYGFDPHWHQNKGAVEISVRQARDFYYVPAITLDTQLTNSGQLPNPNLDKEYEFLLCSLREDWQNGWEDSLMSTVNPRYLRLPDDTIQGAWAYLNEHEDTLPDSLYDATAVEIADWIRSHLQNHVPYDLTTPNMPQEETDLALWFLNRAESGYCVHYATAAAVLLRACGIPARYVEGYAIHVQKDRTVTVRELHAHAWVEYYVNEVGWLVLEATPSGGTAPEEPETTEPTETQPTTTASPTAPTTSPVETQPDPVKPEKPLPTWIKPLLASLAWALAIPVLLWGQYRLRRRLFHRSIQRAKPNQRALVIHRRLCRLSRWTGEPVPAELTQLAQKARFSHHTLTRSELSRLHGHLKLMESAVSLLPLLKRLPAKWIFARY